MLSERGLAIIEKLIENNRKPITARALAISLGVSERSVKTYIKEVSDFCAKKGLVLNRKPGIGFEADFTDGQIGELQNLVDNRAVSMSRQQDTESPYPGMSFQSEKPCGICAVFLLKTRWLKIFMITGFPERRAHSGQIISPEKIMGIRWILYIS